MRRRDFGGRLEGMLLALAVAAGHAALAAEDEGRSPSRLEAARQLHREGALDAALESYRAVTSAAGDAPADVATARNNSCALLSQLGRYQEALEACEEALALRRRLGEPEAVARTLNNTGLALQHLGAYGEAEAAFREALAINQQRGDLAGQAINRSNLGVVATLAGRYGEALRAHRGVARLALEHRPAPWAAEQLLLARLNEGVVLEKLGAYREALAAYRAARELAAEADPWQVAALDVNLGVVYRNLGDPVTAERHIREAAATFRSVGDRAGESNALLNLALVRHLNLGRLADAEADLRRALELARESGDRTEEIQDLFYLGDLLLARDQPGAARSVFREALAAARESGSAEGTWSALAGLGRVAERRGDLRRALARLEEAIATIEQVRSGVAQEALRAGYFGERRPVYAAAVRVLGRLQEAEPRPEWASRSFALAQRAKARELVDVLRGDPSAAVPPLDQSSLLPLVGDGAIIEYFLGEGEIWAWQLDAEGLRFVALGAAEPILDDVAALHRSLADGAEPDRAVLARLAGRLLPPQHLRLAADRLWIAADGRLRYLPFELLPDPAGDGPLVARVAIGYLPSAATLGHLGSPPGGRRFGLLGVGAPEPGEGADLEPLLARLQLAPLPGAREELLAAAAAVPGTSRLLTGAEATEAALAAAVREGARVLHIASHTVVDESLTAGAAVLLAPGRDGDGDGLLRPDEVARLPLAADLTVLAACSTALGSGDDGRGFAGLTGAFLAAGTPAVLATLWDVDDAASRAFMEQLYHHLGRGATPVEAVAAAKRSFLADERWPTSAWAGFVLVGEAPPVVPPPWRRPAAAAALAAVLAAGAAAAFALRRRARRTAVGRGAGF